MKLAISGKGGVGKTTLTGQLAYHYAGQGHKMLAIDADPSPCLGPALGFPPALLEKLTPIAQMSDLIRERTGAAPGEMGGYFRLNPRVDDIPERFAVTHRGIRLLELGGVEVGGSGCICPESALLKALITHLLLRHDEIVLLDMYAGVEHLGRATAAAVDGMIVVVEPTARSLATAAQITSLAADIGLQRLFLVGNKIQSAEELAYIEQHIPATRLLGYLPYNTLVREADRRGQSVYDIAPQLAAATQQIAATLEGIIESAPAPVR